MMKKQFALLGSVLFTGLFAFTFASSLEALSRQNGFQLSKQHHYSTDDQNEQKIKDSTIAEATSASASEEFDGAEPAKTATTPQGESQGAESNPNAAPTQAIPSTEED